MDEITSQLHATAADPPATRIDVEHLISTERRRRRHRSWVWSGIGVAAAVAAVAVVPALVAGGPPHPISLPVLGLPTGAPSTPVPLCAGVNPQTSGPLPPLQSHDTVRTRPTEAAGAGVARLTGALRDALPALLPSGVWIDPALKGCSEPQFQYHPRYREYTVDGTVRRGEESGVFLIRVMPTPADEAVPSCRHALDPDNCEVVDYPNGSAALVSSMVAGPGQRQLWVMLLRPDGTSVLVITSNFRGEPGGNRLRTSKTADEPLLTVEQLAAIAWAPGLTLYP
ncbi:hypothetical protein [Micromonospora sp. RTGN7]|uniref:hypothetical protein n=1 Tax=Micromonospora sp. RTGN7 TaxID=3016526 RepID=UPI0029FF3D90|nr:hypothetical protein [Micromonospora sp. RTGN7]